MAGALPVLPVLQPLRGNTGEEFSFATCSAVFSIFLSAMGSVPVAASALASSRRSLASARETAGYLPKTMSFSLPSHLYAQRHIFPPEGVTQRNILPPSLIL
jgi:hypothetical protein